MSCPPRENPAPRSKWQIVGLAVVALAIVGLQIGLPWAACRFGDQRNRHAAVHWNLPWDQHWTARLRFERVFNPTPVPDTRNQCLSATICQDELVALFSTIDPTTKLPIGRNQLLRCHLKTGSVSLSTAPDDLRYVLSDGKTLWLLPGMSSTLYPFVWEGRPAALVASQKQDSLCQLVEYVGGAWTETDRFALLPDSFAIDGEPTIAVHTVDGQIYLILASPSRLFYRTTLELGSEAEAREFVQLHPRFIKQMNTAELRSMGWIVDRRQDARDHLYTRFWFEGDDVMRSLEVSSYTTLNSGGVTSQPAYALLKHEGRSSPQITILPSPIPRETEDSQESLNSSYSYDRGQIRLVTNASARKVVLQYNRADGRIVVMELIGTRLKMVAQLGSALIWSVLVDFAMIFGLGVGIPTMMLGLLAGGVQWRQGPVFFCSGHERFQLASVARRGIARVIDLVPVGTLVGLSIIEHPEVLAWWTGVVHGDRRLRLKPLTIDFDWDIAQRYYLAFQEFALSCLSVSFEPWLMTAAILFVLIQIVLQGRTGYTIGKRLMGIRVVRTTLRPCGIARSLLREVLLTVDSPFLISWVPGVIEILASTKSQRIGDLISDTVIVDARSASSSR